MPRRRRVLPALFTLSIAVAGVAGISVSPAGAAAPSVQAASSAAMPAAAAAVPRTPTLDDAADWWAFEEGSGTTTYDVAGANNATLHSPAAFSGPGPSLEGSNPGTLAFNGAGYATAPATGLGGLQQLTLVSWVKVTSLPTGPTTLVSIDGKAGLLLDPIGSANLLFQTEYASGSRGIFANVDWTGGAWHLITATYDGTIMRLYVDGVEVNSLPGSVALTPGSGITLGDPAHAQSVAIDEVRIYPRALSLTEIRRLAFNCANVSTIPASECHALEDLYLATDGAAWSTTPNWLTNNDPCSWTGLFCLNGHVALLGLPSDNLTGVLPLSLSNLPGLISLDLSGNHLTGPLPATLGSLTQLQTFNVRNNAFTGGLPGNIGQLIHLRALNLANNRLTGDVTTGVTGLTGLTGLDLSNNGIDPTATTVRDFFTAYEPDWLASQTVAPAGVHTTSVTGTTATLGWTPIAYTGDGGYYEVLSVDPSSGAATPVGQTADKSATGFALTGLAAGHDYSFEVRTVTPPHGVQLNTVTSEPGAPVAASTLAPVTTEENSPAVAYDSWSARSDPAADGGGFRVSRTAGATATFPFSGPAVTWLTVKAPDRGRAAVTVDGVSKGTVDLYAAAPAAARFSYGGLGTGAHRLTIRVLGTKRAAASAADVPVDGFLVGTSTIPVQETAPALRFDTWTTTTRAQANGGSYRSTAAAGATAVFGFVGSGVDWITAFGPTFGNVTVSLDGGPAATVDLYRATASWRAVGRSFPGLSPGAHTITIRVLGTKNAASTGRTAVIDAFRVTN